LCLFNLADEKDKFPLVLVGGVLEGNKKWDISGEVIKCISKVFPGTNPIWPEVSIFATVFFGTLFLCCAHSHAGFWMLEHSKDSKEGYSHSQD
jgi:hypothetical protein